MFNDFFKIEFLYFMDYNKYLLSDTTYSRKGNVIIKTVFDDITKEQKVTQLCLIDDKDHKNKDIIQSYIVTAIKYDFSVYEKRILYRIVECFQHQLEGKKLDGTFTISKDIGAVEITIPVSSLLLDGEGKNYSRVKKAILSLESKRFLYEDSMEFGIIRLVERPTVLKYNHNIQFNLHPKMYNILLDFTKGYRKYELDTAMAFRSVYSMRFYELISGQNSFLRYSIDTLKSMFSLGDSYKYVSHFVNRVIEPAKRELDLKAPYSFTYTIEYEFNREKKGRKKVVGITFIPVYHSKNRDKILNHKDLSRNIDLTNILLPDEMNIFFSLNFTENELKDKYYELIYDIAQARKHGVIILTYAIIKYAQKAKKPKNYLVRSLKKRINQWKEDLIKKQVFVINKKNIKYAKDELSVYSFLKNHLGLLGNELERGVNYVMKEGGGDYFNKLLSLTGADNEKIKDQIKCGIDKKSTESKMKLKHSSKSKIVKLQKSNSVFLSNSMINIESDKKDTTNINIVCPLKVHSSINKSKHKQLIDGWEKLVVQNLSFKEKIIYIMNFKSKHYLIKKAYKKKISIYYL